MMSFMSEIDQPLVPDFASKVDKLIHQLEGTEAAIQAAVRMGDDQEWLGWLQRRHDELQRQLAEEQAK